MARLVTLWSRGERMYEIADRAGTPSPDKFYKGGSQEKIHPLRLEFFLLPSPRDRARSVLNGRAMDSGAGHCDPAVWIFSTSGFHRLFATKPFSSETSKAERWSGASRVGGGALTR